jgi:hypothetical protein
MSWIKDTDMASSLTATHIAETHALLMEIYRGLRDRHALTVDEVVDFQVRCLNNAIRLKVHCLDTLPAITIKQE